MKNPVRILLALVAALTLSACAGSIKTMPDGKVLAMATVGDTLDRSSSFTALYERDAHGNLQQIDARLDTGPTVGGQIAVGITSGMGAAAIQGVSGLAIAREKTRAQQCPPGTQVCHGSVTQAIAGATSQSSSDSNVNVGIQSGGSKPIHAGGGLN